MGFLDTATAPGSNTPVTATKSSGTGFLATASTPSAAEVAQTQKNQQGAQETKVLVDNANEANSWSGMFKNTIGSIWDTVKTAVNPEGTSASDYVKAIPGAIESFGKATEQDPFAGIGYITKGIADAATQSLTRAGDAGGNIIFDMQSHQASTPKEVANVANLISGAAGLALSPLSGAFTGSQKIPVFKQVADILNIPMSIVGVSGSIATGQALDAIPESYLSKQSKDVLRKPLQDLGSLTAQIVIGGKIMEKVGDVVKSGRPVTPVEAQRIVAEVKAENDPIFNPDNHPEAQVPVPHKMTHAEYSQSMGYEPIKPDSELPIIRMGPKPTTEGPVISPDEPLDVNRVLPDQKRIDALAPEDRAKVISATRSLYGKGMDWKSAQSTALARFEDAAKQSDKPLTIEPIKESKPVVPIAKIETTKVATKPGSKSAPTELSTVPVEKITPSETGGKSESGLAAGVKAEAIKAGLESSIGKLPEYGRMDMAEQAALAKKLIDSNPDLAMRVAHGEEPSPIPHLLPESVFTALRIVARETNDAGLFHRLAEHSNTTELARVMGQRIKALDSGVSHDALSIMQDVRDQRTIAIEKKSKGTIEKTKKEVADGIKKEIKEAVSKRPSWDDFIKEIQCQF